MLRKVRNIAHGTTVLLALKHPMRRKLLNSRITTKGRRMASYNIKYRRSSSLLGSRPHFPTPNQINRRILLHQTLPRLFLTPRLGAKSSCLTMAWWIVPTLFNVSVTPLVQFEQYAAEQRPTLVYANVPDLPRPTRHLTEGETPKRQSSNTSCFESFKRLF